MNPDPVRSSREWLPAPGMLLISLAALLASGWMFGFLPVDDSFISYRYSLNFARGDGLVYNVGERVEGYTNFLWVLLLAGGAKLGLDLVRLGTILGGAASALAVVATHRLGHALLRREDPAGSRDGIIPSVPALFLAISPSLGVYGFCGLETPLFTFLIVSMALLAVSGGERLRDDLAFAAVAFLATLTRPEGGLVFAILVVAAPGPGAFRPRLVRAVRRSAIFAAPLVVHLSWKLSYYGTIVPNTAVAKLEPGLRSVIAGFWYVFESYLEHGLLACGLLLVVSLAFVRTSPLRSVHVLLAVYSLYVVAVGGDYFPFGRFILPVLPFYYLAVADGLGRTFTALRRSPLPLASFAVRLGSTTWTVVLAIAVASAGFAWRDYIVSRENNPLFRYVVAGKWLAEHAPPQTVIASGAAGAIAYYSGLRCIDMLGLNDATIAREGTSDPAVFTPGHSKAAPEYVLSRRPDLVFVPHVYFASLPLTEASAFTFDAMRGEPELMSMPAFRASYRIENVLVDGRFLGFWRRIGSPPPAR